MSDAIAAATHPLDGHLMPNQQADAGVHLFAPLPASIVQVQAWPDTLDAAAKALHTATGVVPAHRPNEAVSEGGTFLITTGLGRWMVVSETALMTDLSNAIGTSIGSVADLSHARAVIRLQGPRARDVLAKGLPVDTHDSVFPVGSAVQSTIHHINVLAHRTDADTFVFYVFRGFAVSFWEWLTDASLEFGVSINS